MPDGLLFFVALQLAEKGKSFVDIQGLTAATMEILLDFVYTETVLVTVENVQELLPAACLLQLKGMFRSASCALILKVCAQVSWYRCDCRQWVSAGLEIQFCYKTGFRRLSNILNVIYKSFISLFSCLLSAVMLFVKCICVWLPSVVRRYITLNYK